MRKFGVEGKLRFTVKQHGQTFSYGTCNPAEDERMNIVECGGKYWLVKYEKDSYDVEVGRSLLAEDTTVANGFYEREWDEFVTPEEWIKQTT